MTQDSSITPYQNYKLIMYFYEHVKIKPIIFIIVKVMSDDMEKYLKDNTDLIFQFLIENNYANDKNILIFNVIKEHKNKIINWILPCKDSDKNVLSKIESDKDLVNNIIIHTLRNINSKVCMHFDKFELKISPCNVNLSCYVDIYF